MKLKTTIDKYFTAMKERDLTLFLSLLKQDAGLCLIMPTGAMITGYDAVAEFHRDFFSDTDWSLTAEPVQVYESGCFGSCLSKINYQDLDQHGQPYQMKYYLYLLFEQVGDRWFLIHDQNTLIKN